MSPDDSSKTVYWVRTVGAPSPDDPRDGELHQFFGALPDTIDLEPWDDEPNDLGAHSVTDATPHTSNMTVASSGSTSTALGDFSYLSAECPGERSRPGSA